MKAALVSIGDELLTGFITNTNAAFLAQGLTQAGLSVTTILTVADQGDSIVQGLAQAAQGVDWVIVTGGLGPTSDDITKRVVANYFGRTLVRDPQVMAAVEARFKAFGSAVTPSNLSQAEVIQGAEVLPNRHGTAPGLVVDHQGVRFVFLPGVPHEMKPLFQDEVLPRILHAMEGQARVAYRVLRTVGEGESRLYEKLTDFDVQCPHCTLAYLPQRSGVQLRMGASGASDAEAQSRLDQAEAFLRGRLGACVIGTEDETLEVLVGALLKKRGQTLAVAESCTGGLVSDLVTNVPGSSDYHLGGVVAYANAVKMGLLSVPETTLLTHGAVSAETAEAMARGVRLALKADWGVATTGIAGPDGGTEEKPVGLVYVACANADSCRVVRHRLSIDRLSNKHRFAQAALNLLRLRLLEP